MAKHFLGGARGCNVPKAEIWGLGIETAIFSRNIIADTRPNIVDKILLHQYIAEIKLNACVISSGVAGNFCLGSQTRHTFFFTATQGRNHNSRDGRVPTTSELSHCISENLRGHGWGVRTYMDPHYPHEKEKGKEAYLYSAFYILCISQIAQAWITQFYLQIHHALPFLRMRSPDGATSNWLTGVRDIYLIYRPRRDERLSWPGWLTHSGQFTHISGHPSATGRAEDRESTPA